jgi:8-oxo-dGTP diphosphatase
MSELKLIDDVPVRRRGVVAVVLRQQRFLIIRRSELVLAPGMLCFPGGGIEAGESETAALEREIREELGATVIPRRRLWSHVTAWEVDLAYWLSELDDHAPLALNPAEVASVHWMTRSEVMAQESLLASNRAFFEALGAREFNLD